MSPEANGGSLDSSHIEGFRLNEVWTDQGLTDFSGYSRQSNVNSTSFHHPSRSLAASRHKPRTPPSPLRDARSERRNKLLERLGNLPFATAACKLGPKRIRETRKDHENDRFPQLSCSFLALQFSSRRVTSDATLESSQRVCQVMNEWYYSNADPLDATQEVRNGGARLPARQPRELF